MILSPVPTLFVSANYSSRWRLREQRKRLLGKYVFVARWLDDEEDAGIEDESLTYTMATRDLGDIANAELFVLDTTDSFRPDSGAGREFEFGWAVREKPRENLVLIGGRRNLYHTLFLPSRRFSSWDEFALKFREH